jgi:hypothetical protein
MLKIKYYLFKNIYLIYSFCLWAILCASINSYPRPINDYFIISENLNGLENDKVNFFFIIIKNLINFLRSYLPHFLIITTFFIMFHNKKKIKQNNFIIIFLLYIFFQAIGTILNNEKSFTFERSFLLFNSAHAVFAIYLFFLFKLEKFLNQLLMITIIPLFILVGIHLYYLIKEHFENPLSEYLYGSQTWQYLIYDNAFIRVTGLSRSLVLIAIFIFFLLFQKKNKFLTRNILSFLFFITIFIIWWLQSRTAFYATPLIVTLFIFFIYKKNKILSLKSFGFIIICFSLSFFLANKIFEYKENFYLNVNYSANANKISAKENKISAKENKISANENKIVSQNRLFLNNNYTSNRSLIWETMLKNYKYEKIFGYGIQADRYYLGLNIRDNLDYNFYNNASNAFIYSFITGGYFGLISFILINIYILFKIYLIFKKNTFDRHSIYLNTAIVSILFLMIRNIVENNYAVFSTDMVFFLIYSSIVINDSKKYK